MTALTRGHVLFCSACTSCTHGPVPSDSNVTVDGSNVSYSYMQSPTR